MNSQDMGQLSWPRQQARINLTFLAESLSILLSPLEGDPEKPYTYLQCYC